MPGNQTATTVESPKGAVLAGKAAVRGSNAALTVVLLLVWVLALYFPTTISMVSIWRRSETFAHGFVVFPIFVYLLWRQRDELAAIEKSHCLPALLGIAGAGALWFVGEQVNATVVSQLAMIAMVPFAVWAVLGTRVAAALFIPLAFLFFAVPFGEFLVPRLMNWTADFTVAAINASGVPIYREGNYFQIPSGQWSVVEACSGFRYLIASFMVGSLFAYLSYRSTVRRMTFIAASLIVPVIANWLRAYMIVMLGHLSSNRIAVGADHLIYGWLFFGIVMALLFWIGSWWREDDLPVSASGIATQFSTHSHSTHPQPPHSRRWPVLLAVIALTAMWPPLQASLAQGARGGSIELDRIGDRNGWISVPERLSNWRPDLSGASAEMMQTFAKDGRVVALYVALYRDQTPDAKAITSTNQLVRTSNKLWKQVDNDTSFTMIDGQRFSARTAVITDSRQRLAVWQWFWVNGHETSSEFLAKFYQAISVLQGRGDGVAGVFVYAPADSETASSSDAVAQFTADMHGSINASLAQVAAP
jgi:exosortase A